MLAREVGIRKVLVICPATLKSQWRNEIQRFSERDCQLVIGSIADRARQYANDCFFTVCNYEQVLRDILAIEQLKWDLIILDEGQTHQELGSQDQPDHQRIEIPLRPGVVRHAYGKPAGRAVFGRGVHRRPASGPRCSRDNSTNVS